MAGILAHARGMIAVLAPLVNSYKRLVPGLRGADVPHLGPDEPLGADPRAQGLAGHLDRGDSGRGSLPGPVLQHVPGLRRMLAAGLDGVEKGWSWPSRSRKASTRWTRAGSRSAASSELPGTLGEAIDELEKDEVIREALGDHVLSHYLDAKREEWDDYRTQVTQWEIDRYLEAF